MKQPTANDKPDNTADLLIQAGRTLFARHGYDGASVRALTKAANANLGAITYHFGSKRALYESVVATVINPLAHSIVQSIAAPGSALDRAEAAERAFFAYFAATAEAPALLLQELTAGREPPVSATTAMRRIHSALAALVAEGQADGSMREGEPALMALSMIAQPAHLHLVRVPLHAATGIDLFDPSTSRRVVENAVSFVRAGLAAPRAA